MENGKYEEKDMTGTVWMEVVTKEGKEGPYQVRTGSAKVMGRDFWVNAYERTTKTGKTLLSLTFKPKDAQKPMTETDLSSIPF